MIKTKIILLWEGKSGFPPITQRHTSDKGAFPYLHGNLIPNFGSNNHKHVCRINILDIYSTTIEKRNNNT